MLSSVLPKKNPTPHARGLSSDSATTPCNLPAPAANTHTLKVPYPRCLPDGGVAKPPL